MSNLRRNHPCAEPKMFLLHSSCTLAAFAIFAVAMAEKMSQAIYQSLDAILQPYNIEIY